MIVTPHFDSTEFSQKAGHGLMGEPYPLHWIPSRLLPLCNELEVLRTVLGKPVRVISGYRSELYNRAIKGARLSQHIQGRAADIVVSGCTAAMVHACCLELHDAGTLKIGGLGIYPNFVHIDIRPTKRLIRWTGSRVG